MLTKKLSKNAAYNIIIIIRHEKKTFADFFRKMPILIQNYRIYIADYYKNEDFVM